MADDNKQQALCFALIDPLPKDMTHVAEWYMTQVKTLDNIEESLRMPESSADGATYEMHTDEQYDDLGEIQASLSQ